MPSVRRILVFNQIARKGLERFPATYEVGSEVAEPDAILLRSHDLHQVAIPASVKAIARAGAGVNNIPVQSMNQRGVPVFNAPGANANAVKELVVAAMLMAARNLPAALDFVSRIDAAPDDWASLVESGKKQFAGGELAGKQLGVIGLGAIGSLVADAGIRLGMDVIGYDPQITVEAAWRLPAQVRKAASIDEVLRRSDFVSLHVPLVEATRHLVDADRLRVAKKGATLLNFAREEIVDEAAVAQALAEGKLRYYFCDFPSPRLRGLSNAVAFPHLGASTGEAEENCAIMAAESLIRYLEDGTIRNSVNFPDVEMGRESAYRVAIANANVPNMVGQISTTMAEAALNIHNMVNKSRGDLAYTLLDVDSEVPSAVLDKIRAISGVLMVRALPVCED